MLVYDSCKPTLESCMKTKTFSMARLYNDERTMNIHLHDCYEIYFSISVKNRMRILTGLNSILEMMAGFMDIRLCQA